MESSIGSKFFVMGVLVVFSTALFSTLSGCSARKARPTQLRVHPTNWLAEHPNFVFSNTLEAEYGRSCQSCHGTDYTGGTSGVSCAGCHHQRRDACTGCHGGYFGDTTGVPPYSLSHDSLYTDKGVGGHPVMVKGGPFFSGTDCFTCHIKPAFVLSPAHFSTAVRFRADSTGRFRVSPDSVRAAVTFSGLARLYSGRYGPPVFNPTDGTCANVYCHGAFPGGDTARVMNFYGGPDSTYCGSCHSARPGDDISLLLGEHKTHDSLAIPCITCHYATVDSSNSISGANRRQRHVNGAFDVVFDPTVAPSGLFDGKSCSGLPDSPTCHAGSRNW